MQFKHYRLVQQLNCLFEFVYISYVFQSLVSWTVLISNLKTLSGLPHTQENSGNFQVEENLRESQGVSGNFDLFFKLREVLIFSKKFREVLKF